MVIHSANHNTRGMVLTVHVEGEALECVQNYKYLGIFLDSGLTFSEHIEYTKKKINKRLGVLKLSRKFMTASQCTTLYKALVLPLLYYGDIVFMESSLINLESLQILQNRACRIILKRPRLSPTRQMHHELKLMTLHKRRVYHLNLFTFESLLGLLPEYVTNKIKVKITDHNIATRGTENMELETPRCRLQKTNGAYSVKCPKYYNMIPRFIRDCLTVKSFQSAYLKHTGFV